MITARKDEDRTDNLWRIFDVGKVKGETVETLLFAFNANATWTESEVLANWQQIKNEADGILPPEVVTAQLRTVVRNERDRRLAACDWTQLPDAKVDQAAWATYRQALRDMPNNTKDPANPAWPVEPRKQGEKSDE